MAENFQNLGKEIDIEIMKLKEVQTGSTQWDYNWMHYNQIVESQEQRILKGAREKWLIIYIETHKTISGFLSRNHSGQENGMIYSKCWEKPPQKTKLCQQRIPYPAKLHFKN